MKSGATSGVDGSHSSGGASGTTPIAATSSNSSSNIAAKSKHSLAEQLGRGFAAATVVSMPLAMGVTVFDRSVIQFANGSVPSLSRALMLGFKNVLRSPVACMIGRDNLAVFSVYGSTYIAKNSAEIGANYYNVDKFWYVFFCSTSVNTVAGILKDRYLARMFGKGPTVFPFNSYVNFVARDSVIVGASFNGPTLVSPWLQRATKWSKDVCDVVAQLACPAAAQIIGTPLHMLGLDYYNRQQPVSLGVRIADAIRSSMGPIGARMCRQCYVFGFGGLAVKWANKLAQGE